MKYLFYFLITFVLLIYGCDDSVDSIETYDYSIEQQMGCFCSQGGVWVRLFVKADTVAYAFRISDNELLDYNDYKSYKSIRGLFDLISQTDTNSYVLDYEMDSVYNFPSYIYLNPKAIIFSDSTIAIIEDGQLSYTSKNYVKLN